jgi:hypothetical protein
MFVIRTFEIIRTRSLVSGKFLTKIGTTTLCASIVGAFFFAQSARECSLWLFLIEFATILALILYERRQIDALKSHIPDFLDQWILNLKLGMGLSTARERALTAQRSDFRSLLIPVFVSAPENGEHMILSGAMVREFSEISREPHLALRRLENLREVVRKTADFRRRSGQAALQTRIQCIVMMVLQFALSIFTIRQFGWAKCGDLVLFSTALAIAGFFAMQFFARKRRWKI